MIYLWSAQRSAVELVLAKVHKFGFLLWTFAVTKRGPPGRLCIHRFSIQQPPSKTLCALLPGRSLPPRSVTARISSWSSYDCEAGGQSLPRHVCGRGRFRPRVGQSSFTIAIGMYREKIFFPFRILYDPAAYPIILIWKMIACLLWHRPSLMARDRYVHLGA